jgi:hypothetical protein
MGNVSQVLGKPRHIAHLEFTIGTIQIPFPAPSTPWFARGFFILASLAPRLLHGGGLFSGCLHQVQQLDRIALHVTGSPPEGTPST